MEPEQSPDESIDAGYPDLRDPRLMVAVSRHNRAKLEALWVLSARLSRLLREAREPMIAQIKLAWWRDMLALVASDAASLPRGEPLLADLERHWAGNARLGALADAAEAVLLADTDAERAAGGGDFGARLFELSAERGVVAPTAGRRWGMIWAAASVGEAAEWQALFATATAFPAPARRDFAANKPLLMLDRWAVAIAGAAGQRDLRREGLLLLRLGLIGR